MQRDPYNFDNNKSPLAENLLKSYANTESLQNHADKAEEVELEKGGKKAFIGEKRTFGGREYIRTTDGWKYHGKGAGAKAQEHAAGAQSKEDKKTQSYLEAKKQLEKEGVLKEGKKKKSTTPSDVEEYFADYNAPLTEKFDFKDFYKTVELKKDDAKIFLCNLEDEDVMKEIAAGDYENFDIWDRNIFNDSYDDMMEDLGYDD